MSCTINWRPQALFGLFLRTDNAFFLVVNIDNKSIVFFLFIWSSVKRKIIFEKEAGHLL